MKNRNKIFIFFATAAAFLSLYASIYCYQIGRGVKAEWWIKNVTEKKLQIANKSSNGRLVIVSGSSGLFGINSEVISKEIGKPVVNLAIHAGLDLGYYRMLIEKTIRRGDVVIMPLEYSYYGKKDMFTEWQVNNVLAWGADYLKWMPIHDKIDFFIHTPPSRILDGFLSENINKFDPKEKVYAYIPDGKDYGLDYKSLNAYGDLNLDRKPAKPVIDLINNHKQNEGTLSYGKSSSFISDYTYNQLNLIKDLVSSSGAKLYISWPSTMNTEFFNSHDNQAMIFTKNIQAKLESKGFNFICSPFDSNLDQSLFLDTYYHLTAEGAKIRSERLAKCLSGV